MLKGAVRQKGLPDAPSCSSSACRGEVMHGQGSAGGASAAQGGCGKRISVLWGEWNGTEQAQGPGLVDLCRQVPNKEERWWEPVRRKCSRGREPVCRSSNSVSFRAGLSCGHKELLHCCRESGAAPLCLVQTPLCSSLLTPACAV